MKEAKNVFIVIDFFQWDAHVNLNMYKNNPNINRSGSENLQRPLRRSRRIAHRKGDIDEEGEDEDEDVDF